MPVSAPRVVATSNLATRRMLGWEPAHPGLIADFDNGDYFIPPTAAP